MALLAAEKPKGEVQQRGDSYGALVLVPPTELLDSSEGDSSCGEVERENCELL